METKKKKMPKWLIVIIVIIVIFIIVGVAGGSNSSEESKDEEKELVLEEGYTGVSDEYGLTYTVEGYVSNPTDKDYSYVQIEFTAYDSEGNTIGTCLDNNSGLEKGGRWKFSAMCLENADNIARVELKELTGY